jgi:hypothetical protein
VNPNTELKVGKVKVKVKNITDLKQSGPVCDMLEQALTQAQVQNVGVSQQCCWRSEFFGGLIVCLDDYTAIITSEKNSLLWDNVGIYRTDFDYLAS